MADRNAIASGGSRQVCRGADIPMCRVNSVDNNVRLSSTQRAQNGTCAKPGELGWSNQWSRSAYSRRSTISRKLGAHLLDNVSLFELRFLVAISPIPHFGANAMNLMDPTDLIRSPGYIFGPGMLLAGLIALIICLRASWSRQSFDPRRSFIWSAAPLMIGIMGAMIGCILAVIEIESWPAAEKGPVPEWALERARMHLGFTILFGLFVSSVPLVWTGLLYLRSSRPQCS